MFLSGRNRLFCASLLLWLYVTTFPVLAVERKPQAPLLIYGQPVEIIGGAVKFTGKMTDVTPGTVSAASGTLRLSASVIRWPSARKPLYIFHKAFLVGHIDYAKAGNSAISFTLSSGTFHMASFHWKSLVLDSISGGINYQHGSVMVKSCQGILQNHPWTLTAEYQPASGILHASLMMTNINQKLLFQFFAPSKLDVIGPARVSAEFTWKPHQRPVGSLTLSSVGPGMLKIKNVPILSKRVVNAYGRRMATLMVEDLREYPFVTERLTASETAKGMQIRFHFVRGKSNPQKLKPHLIKIDGHEVMYRPRDLKSYSSTITLPNTGIYKLYKLAREFTHPDAH